MIGIKIDINIKYLNIDQGTAKIDQYLKHLVSRFFMDVNLYRPIKILVHTYCNRHKYIQRT